MSFWLLSATVMMSAEGAKLAGNIGSLKTGVGHVER